MDLLAREPHRVIVGALRSALGTLGHVPAGQLRLEVGLRVHCAFPPRFSRARAPKWRSPEVVASTFHRRVWPNRGAARPDSHPDVNVLAVLHPRNTINDWLIKKSHLGHTRDSLSQKTAGEYRESRPAKSRIEAKLGARLGDRDRAVVVRDVVDAGRAPRDREQRGGGRSVDVQRRPRPGGCLTPRALPI